MKNKLFLVGLIIGFLPISQNYAEKPLWTEFAWLNGSWSTNPPQEGMWNSPFTDELDTSWGKVRFFNEPMVIDLPGKIIYDKVSVGVIDKVYQLNKKTVVIEYHYERGPYLVTMKITKLDQGGYRFEATPNIMEGLAIPPIFYKIDGQIMPYLRKIIKKLC